MLFLIHLDPVMLYDQLLGPFVHHSRRNITTDDPCSAVIAVTVDPPIRCSSGSSIAFNVFGVSFWFFPSCLFNCYRTCFTVTGLLSPA